MTGAPGGGSTEPTWSVGVVTVAHRGDDARIRHRQIRSLLDAGASVTYVAPPPSGDTGAGLDRVVVRRAVGRRRLAAWWDAFRAVRAARGRLDILLVHDLEAVLPVRLARPGCPVVWDVHEDVVATVGDREWIPGPLRRVVALSVALAERAARRGCRLILAEHSYATRYGGWPVIPNTTWVPAEAPPPGDRPRIVYLGRISAGRGLERMIELGRRVAPDIEVVLIGPVDAGVEAVLRAAVDDGTVTWLGPMRNDAALAELAGATAGLSLLAPLPNYVGSMPTKLHEYLAWGVPPITTPLPLAVDAVERSGCGTVVEWDDLDAVEAAARAYASDPDRRRAEGRHGHRWVQEHHDWRADGARFVAHLRAWSR